MSEKELTSKQIDAIVNEAITQYEDEDSAKAIAFVVQETDAHDREATLKAVVDEVNPEDLSRLEQRDLFLIQRRKRQQKARDRFGHIATQLVFDSRR